MDKIAKTSSLISEIVKVYSNPSFQEDLKIQMEALRKRILELLNLNAGDALISSNSVRPVKYYSVIGRVKEVDSFHEKMIRGNLVYEFIEKAKLSSKKDITKQVEKIRTLIKEICDDIIGIKILTQVEDDCESVSKLLKNIHPISLNNIAEIYLDKEELDKQPGKMKNGFPFYKVPGTFLSTYKFELQIKSKLFSVWGDMDHSMFYKDYSVSPIKGNVKKSMRHLGNLILEADKFLLQIRESNKDFSKNRDVINFTEEFSLKYSDTFKSKLGFGYRFEDISDILFFFYKKLKNSNKKIRANIDYSNLTIKCKEEINSKYIKLRNKDFNLQLIELVYFDWFVPSYTSKEKKTVKYDSHISNLLTNYIEFMRSMLTEENIQNDSFFKESYKSILVYFIDGTNLYKSDRINSFFESYKLIKDNSDFDIKFETPEKFEYIIKFFFLVFLEQNVKDFISENSLVVTKDELIKSISVIKFSYEESSFEALKKIKNAEIVIKNSLLALK